MYVEVAARRGARIEIGNKDGGQSNFYGVVTIFQLYFKSCGQGDLSEQIAFVTRNHHVAELV